MRIAAIFLLGFAFAFTAVSQPLQVYEVGDGKAKLAIGSLSVVDINSQLEISINIDSLTLMLTSQNNGHPEMQKMLKEYSKIIESQARLQKIINKEFDEDVSIDSLIENLDQYSQETIKILNQIGASEKLLNRFNDMTEWMALSESEQAKWGDDMTPWFIEQLNLEAQRAFKEMNNDLITERVTVQLYAYIHTKKESYRRIHIENFDDFSSGEFENIERFATSFSEKDLEALQFNQQLANQLNVLVDENFENFGRLLKENIQSYKAFMKLYKDVDSIYQFREQIFKENQKARVFIEGLRLEIQSVLTEIQKIQNLDLGSKNGISNVFSSLTEFKQIQESFLNKKENFNSQLKGLNQEGKNVLEVVKLDLELCLASINADLENAENIYKKVSKLVLPSKRVVETSKDIADDAFQFSIDNLPKSGYINVKTAGKREDKDQIEIQLKITRPEISDKAVILEKKFLNLYQVKVHSISNISLILASPYNFSTDVVKLENKFQFAPAGNLLFKKGSRTSRTWNFINPGLGFSMSTPDFDLDGVPEVGIGAVVTLLNDVLSAGVSYNTKTDNPYWFFGLSLPFNMMGLPVNTVEVEKIGP